MIKRLHAWRAKRRILKKLRKDWKTHNAKEHDINKCPDCGEYAYNLGKCNECGITDGYLWCQRCGEPCWNIERTQCEECGFTD